MKCTLCGYPNEEGVTACRACQGPLADATVVAGGCPRCHAVNPPGAVTCAQCGDLVATGTGEHPDVPQVLLPAPDWLSRVAEGERDPGLFPADVLSTYAAGRRVEAHAALAASLKADPGRAPARVRQLQNRRQWAEPCAPPGMFTFNGLGATCYGHEDALPDGTFIITYYAVVFFVPVYASGAYLVRRPATGRGWSFLARVPVSEGNARVKWVALAAIAALVLFGAGFGGR